MLRPRSQQQNRHATNSRPFCFHDWHLAACLAAPPPRAFSRRLRECYAECKQNGTGTKATTLDLPSVQAEVRDQKYLAFMQLVYRGRVLPEEDPAHKKLYRAFLKLVRKCGPVKVNVNKSRISFQARVRFAGVPRVTKDGLVGGFWLKHQIHSPRFTRVEFLPPNNYIYQFQITSEKDLDTAAVEVAVETRRVWQACYGEPIVEAIAPYSVGVNDEIPRNAL